ncbi:hypothetical protein PVAND_014705 [Polypedilum vanderplanki]|uniref:Uncharacterized protein n=1 Tax=Polypedilum vanderplanki TaxID=319348 RepID=A0A9J6BAG5_POLVA|nr:hypothetical protein PVAND_014705 [Polypedilum vanderplanki]
MVMLFGPTSSPFTSQFVKNKVAEQWQTKYPDSAKALIDYTYMDDGLMSAETVEKAKHIALGCIEILKSINWQLIGFQSNSKEFLKSLPEDHVKKELKPILSSAYDLQSYTTKVLGAVWDPVEDCFKYMYDNDFVKASLSNGHIPTKRDQASTIARMFDVRGEVTHFIIRGRILLQRSWKQGLGWDDTISEDDFKLWIKWLQDLKAISLLKIPRRCSTSINSLLQAERIELHVFADAGKEAFAAAAYFVIEVQKCRQSALVMAKAKVTPLKRNTRTEISQMPRLEMTACLIAARMAHTIKEFHAHLSFKIYMCKLEKFAIPMVEEILDKTERNEWNYVSSDQNPADKATKFQKFDFSDPNSIWFKGPAFLLLPEQSWPKKDVEETTNNQKLTIATCQALIKPTQIVINNFVLPPIDCQFSSNLIHRLPNSIKSNWMKLIRLIARALKLIELVKKCAAKEFRPNRKDAMELEPMDYEKAELFVARQMQYDVYSTEYKALAKGYPISNKDFLALRIFMDSNGILRINSRVNLDPDIYPQKFFRSCPGSTF